MSSWQQRILRAKSLTLVVCFLLPFKVKLLTCVRLFATPWTVAVPCSSFHGIFQTRILGWVAISFSRRSSWPRDWTRVSCIVGRGFTVGATREVLPLKGERKTVWHLQPIASIWRSLAFLLVTSHLFQEKSGKCEFLSVLPHWALSGVGGGHRQPVRSLSLVYYCPVGPRNASPWGGLGYRIKSVTSGSSHKSWVAAQVHKLLNRQWWPGAGQRESTMMAPVGFSGVWGELQLTPRYMLEVLAFNIRK